MSPEQFTEANRRIQFFFRLVLFLTSCAATGLAFALPALVLTEWVRTHRGEGVYRTLFGLLVAGVVLAPFFLVPLLSFLWLNRRFGLRCPGCRRFVTLRCRPGDVLRSGRCCLCGYALFEPREASRA